MWTEGNIKAGKGIFRFCIKHYKEPSEFRIDGGRISKLTITK